MFRSVVQICVVCCSVTAVLSDRVAMADLVKLKGGGELRGVFLDKVNSSQPKSPVRVETLTGGVITVSPDDVLLVAKRGRNVEEYEWRARLVANTVDAHWELQEWCKQQGLKKERDLELQAVVSLDPNHETAHRLLGHIRQDGKWMSRDDAMAAKGYVKYKGKYLFPQEVALLESTTVHRESETVWYKKLHTWQGWLRGNNPAQQLEARRELAAISDSDAVGPLVRLFRNDPADDVRIIFVETLARLEGTQAIQSLVIQSLFDASSSVRSAAMGAITGKAREIAIPIYTKALHDDLNVVVLRSAVALAHFGDVDSVPHLIDALITTHSYRQTVQEKGYLATNGGAPLLMNTEVALPPRDIPLTIPGVPFPLSATSPTMPYGAVGPSNTVSVPTPITVTRPKTIVVTQPHQNVEVLAALRKLTGEDFGYDKRTWKLWWTSRRSGANQ